MLGFEDGSSSGSSSEDGFPAWKSGKATKVGESLFSFRRLLNIKQKRREPRVSGNKNMRDQVPAYIFVTFVHATQLRCASFQEGGAGGVDAQPELGLLAETWS